MSDSSSSSTLSQSDVGTLRRVLVKRVEAAFRSQEFVDRHWRKLNYLAAPDLARAAAEQERFLELLQARGASLHYLPDAPEVGMDSLYVRDASILCERGVILCNMGKQARRGEPRAQRRYFETAELPIRGAIRGPGTLEGGDVVWLDPRTLAVGHGYRTNGDGIHQLRELVAGTVDEVIVVPLPHWKGPGGVFHLMSILSPLDSDLALVYSPLMPVPFRRQLSERGYRFVEVPDAEFESLGCNSLAIAPRVCLLPTGNPVTRARLEHAGVEVLEFEANELCVKGGGGPTCMTRPLTWTLQSNAAACALRLKPGYL